MSKKLTQEEFIKKAKVIHGNKYDYSLVIYQGSKIKVTIICKECGYIFEQIPNSHLIGKGCPKCGRTKKLTLEEFILRSNIIHDNFYSYDKTLYVDSKTGIIISCPIHGDFKQNPASHLQGVGCKNCAIENRRLGKEEFIKCSNLIHHYFYDYSLVEYKNNDIRVLIICPIHGIFEQVPSSHLQGYGCEKCTQHRSKGEIEIYEYIRSLYSGEVLENDRTIIKPKELDIYLPELKLAFEYNGDYWHKLHEDRNLGYHENKRNQCIERGITLIEIWESKWKKNKDQIKLLIQEEIKKAESLV